MLNKENNIKDLSLAKKMNIRVANQKKKLLTGVAKEI